MPTLRNIAAVIQAESSQRPKGIENSVSIRLGGQLSTFHENGLITSLRFRFSRGAKKIYTFQRGYLIIFVNLQVNYLRQRECICFYSVYIVSFILFGRYFEISFVPMSFRQPPHCSSVTRQPLCSLSASKAISSLTSQCEIYTKIHRPVS